MKPEIGYSKKDADRRQGVVPTANILSEESENTHTNKEIWGSTIATFLTKFLFAMTFAVPILLLPLFTALVVSVIWGLSILAVLSYVIARARGGQPWRVVGEHLLIAGVVIGITHWVGHWIAALGA